MAPWMVMWAELEAIATPSPEEPEAAAPAEERPPKVLQGWEKPMVHVGLGVMGVSAVGGALTYAAMVPGCSERGHCFDLIAPLAIGAIGVTLGGVTTLVGGAGIAAAPRRGGGDVTVTFVF
ncbi:MAG: hypothetical protein ABMA64_11960 [Myxococcota bacterium]